jgi:hypothetical protein
MLQKIKLCLFIYGFVFSICTNSTQELGNYMKLLAKTLGSRYSILQRSASFLARHRRCRTLFFPPPRSFLVAFL